MPRIYRRDCDTCGHHYTGVGKKYCSPECANMARMSGYIGSKIKQKLDTVKTEITAKWETETAKKLWKERAWTSLITNLCLDAIQTLPEPTLEKRKQSIKSNNKDSTKVSPKHTECANLMISDVELGQTVDLVETGGYGEYNHEIFKKRAVNLKYGVEQILNLHQSLYQIKELNVFFLGDIVHGMNLAGAWGPAYLEFDVVKQMFLGINTFTELLMYWAQFVDKINVIGVPGNHGRAAKGSAERYYVNWDYILLEFMKTKLQNYKNITWNIDTSWFKLVEIMGQTVLCVHGDDTNSWMGLPFYGLVRDTKSYKSMFEKKIDFVLLGHHHTLAELPIDKTTLKVNGTWVGGSTYSLKKCKATSSPVQRMFGLCYKGETFEYKMYLDRERNI